LIALCFVPHFYVFILLGGKKHQIKYFIDSSREDNNNVAYVAAVYQKGFKATGYVTLNG